MNDPILVWLVKCRPFHRTKKPPIRTFSFERSLFEKNAIHWLVAAAAALMRRWLGRVFFRFQFMVLRDACEKEAKRFFLGNPYRMRSDVAENRFLGRFLSPFCGLTFGLSRHF
ncbi:MAG: hypothetical protein WCH98_06720 [Verrucomicrobiota bacterium]